MDSHLPEYELYAIRYAERDARRSDHFIGGDLHDGPMPMDYFVWAAIGRERSFVIDTGFTAEVAAARGRRHLRCPAEALTLVGLDRNTVPDVILIHMHYDHVGTFHRFPAAQFHLQEVELHYTTGRHMRYPFLARSFEVEDVIGIVRLNFAPPGQALQRAGRACAGHQSAPGGRPHAGYAVRPRPHEPRQGRPRLRRHPLLREYGDRPALHRRVSHRRDARGLRHIERPCAEPAAHCPRHDPLIMRRYPPAKPELEGIVVRLDVMPKE